MSVRSLVALAQADRLDPRLPLLDAVRLAAGGELSPAAGLVLLDTNDVEAHARGAERGAQLCRNAYAL